MKKFLIIALICNAIIITTSQAQTSVDNAAVVTPAKEEKKPTKEEIKSQMMEKTGLTAAQAQRVMEINYEIREMAAEVLPGLNDEDRAKKIGELKAAKGKKYSEIPLTRDQIKAVYTFFESMGNRTQKAGS